MNQPKVSVIIPVYNAEKYLRQCLDSVINQTLRDIEIICVDDGSADQSMDILQEYKNKDKRIKVIEQINQYAGMARNNGLKIATGRYVHFLDSDDWIESNMYQVMVNAIERENAEVCVCFHETFDNVTGETMLRAHHLKRGKHISTTNFKDNPTYFLRNVVVPWNKIYLREFITSNNIQFDDLICSNDRSFYVQILLHAKTIAVLEEYLVHYRVNNNASLVGEKRLKNFECHFKSYEKIWDLVQKESIDVKRLILNVSLDDFFAFYKKSSGELREKIASMLIEYLPTMPLNILTDDSQKFMWYNEYIKLLNGQSIGGKLSVKELQEITILKNKNLDELVNEIIELRRKNYLEKERRRLTQRELEALQNSISYKIYCKLIWLPKKVKGGIQCYKEHGFKHTFKRTLFHLHLLQNNINSKSEKTVIEKKEVIDIPEREHNGIRYIPKVIVSFTTYPARVKCAAMVVDSITKQSYKPDKIILWLAEEQFANKFEDLPNELQKLAKDNIVEIGWCDDIKPHKKYYYTMKNYPDDIIITIDDDVYYEPELLERLLSSYIKYPDMVSCMRGHTISMKSPTEFEPYTDWKREKKIVGKPSALILPTGVGGVLYPPHCLSEDIFDKDKINSLCLMTDDLWLKWMQLKKDVKCVLLKSNPKIKMIDGSQEEALWLENSENGKNDVAWKKIIDADNGISSSGKNILEELYVEYSQLDL